MTTIRRWRWLCLLTLSILLPGLVGAADAAPKGGRASLLLVFDDLPGDRITSDGLGAYAVQVGRDGARTVTTGTRTMHFDFSSSLAWFAYTPFAGAAAGDIDHVTMTVSLVDETSGTATFEFSGDDPEGSGTTDFILSMAVSVSQSGDTWTVASASEATLLFLWQSSGPRGRGHYYPPSWEQAGVFDMPWGAQIAP